MVDLIKFYLENISLSDYILTTKFIKIREEGGFEIFKADPDMISFLSQKVKAGNCNLPKHGIVVQQENIIKKLSYQNKFISFKRRLNAKSGRLSVCQNVRKDFIRIKNLNPFTDLNYLNFVEIIEMYAREFGIEKEKFWKAKITQVELGVNIRFNMNIASIMSSVSRMKGMENTLRIGNTVNFKNQKYEVAIYDKLGREAQQGEVFKGTNKVRRRHLVKKIAKNNSFVRIELRVKTVSQFNRASIKSKIKTLESVRNNFHSLGEELYKLFVNISFVDEISPDIDQYLVKSQLNSKSVKAFNDYLIFLGLKYFGIKKFVDFAFPILNTNNRNSYIEKLENLFNKYKGDNDFVKKEFQRKLSARINKLTVPAFSSSN
ncbi:hypothetical protein C1637_09515 [Chryseobacterium lactis]|uniref:CYTH domain-containing protein n=1 Tax=Chryseobacterium lactis TaxID=1241981 RepID=A0A3G6RC59_CHRLC|nr:hypothetical protein [Chryseobacterium lactis]AZA82250.1 hypothetical protein EG342_10190 [Chryseobacterium lactis]AZB02632.1 hypothetical protein EG341_01050 [Chryseobacterium lactis]PNW14075.1 hypothetical protein C1637_09515 [Chryseobacterium lactis]